MNLIIPAAVLGAVYFLATSPAFLGRARPPAFVVPPAGAIPPSTGGGTSSGGTSSGGDRALVRRLQTGLNAYHIGLCRNDPRQPSTTINLCRSGTALVVDGIFGPLSADSLARMYRDMQETGAPSVDAWRRLSTRERERITATVETGARQIAAMTYTERRELLAEVRG
jgi:hypothetical protein